MERNLKKRKKESLSNNKASINIFCKVVSILLLVLWVCFIFRNSSEVAEVSSQKSTAIVLWINEIISEKAVRKLAHLFEYSVLGGLLVFTVKSYYTLNKKGIFYVLFSGFLIAVCDELIQLTAEGRSAQVSDVCLDFSGVVLGATALILLFRYVAGRYINKTK